MLNNLIKRIKRFFKYSDTKFRKLQEIRKVIRSTEYIPYPDCGLDRMTEEDKILAFSDERIMKNLVFILGTIITKELYLETKLEKEVTNALNLVLVKYSNSMAVARLRNRTMYHYDTRKLLHKVCNVLEEREVLL